MTDKTEMSDAEALEILRVVTSRSMRDFPTRDAFDHIATRLRAVDAQQPARGGEELLALFPSDRPESDDPEAINDTPYEEGYDTGWNAALHAVRQALAQPRTEQPAAEGPGDVFAWVKNRPRGWDVVHDADLRDRPNPEEMRRKGWFPVYTTPPRADAEVDEESVFRLACWMAEQDGCDDVHHLIWEGSPPEPWGEVWNRYEDNARAALTAALNVENNDE